MTVQSIKNTFVEQYERAKNYAKEMTSDREAVIKTTYRVAVGALAVSALVMKAPLAGVIAGMTLLSPKMGLGATAAVAAIAGLAAAVYGAAIPSFAIIALGASAMLGARQITSFASQIEKYSLEPYFLRLFAKKEEAVA